MFLYEIFTEANFIVFQFLCRLSESYKLWVFKHKNERLLVMFLHMWILYLIVSNLILLNLYLLCNTSPFKNGSQTEQPRILTVHFSFWTLGPWPKLTLFLLVEHEWHSFLVLVLFNWLWVNYTSIQPKLQTLKLKLF